MKLEIEDVSIRLLESAIWTYAFDLDEVIVHLAAGAAFELHTKRLSRSELKKQLDIKLKLESINSAKFWSDFNRSYTFIKHGEINYKQIAEVYYDPFQTDLLLFLCCEANLTTKSSNKLMCAEYFQIYFYAKYPNIFIWDFNSDELKKIINDSNINGYNLAEKSTLKILINSINKRFK